jgi:small-conductance mechanosensitive channel
MRLCTLETAALGIILTGLTALTAQPGHAQTVAAQGDAARLSAAAVADAQPAPQPATLVYANRAIVVFRATLLSRTPAERVAAAIQFIDRIVEDTPITHSTRVTSESVGDAVTIHIGEPAVFVILPPDVNSLAGETLEQTSAAAVASLQQAFDEALELRSPRRLLRAVLLAMGATLLCLGLLWGLRRSYRASTSRLNRTTERQLEKLSAGADIVRASHLPELLRGGVALISILLALVITYMWVTFVLRRFPYTRPWGESLRSALVTTTMSLGRHVLDSLPDVLTVLVIVVATRFVVRLSNYVFEAIQQNRVEIRGLHPETAQSTRRIVTALLWLLAIVVAYPYLPGSESDAFKGVSVFLGLMISLGSSGIMNQAMSGLMLTYSRAFRVGDFVKIGDVEGTVEQLGVLSLKIKSPRREAITIPNALVVATATTNYSRFAQVEGVQVSTSVTIGYDTPWRQVEALLLLAASRTPGVRKEPPPVVRRSALLDFYVQYTLLVCLEQPHLRAPTLDALHAQILDAFNEFGVQITSPNYEADPGERKVVPKEQWFAAPAVAPGETARGTIGVSSGT